MSNMLRPFMAHKQQPSLGKTDTVIRLIRIKTRFFTALAFPFKAAQQFLLDGNGRLGERKPLMQRRLFYGLLACLHVNRMRGKQCKHFFFAQIADMGRVTQRLQCIACTAPGIIRGHHVDKDQRAVRLEYTRHLFKRTLYIQKMVKSQP